nr:MAG TPA: Hepatitis C virus non-structural 5a protein membrane anchor [Bacteriophage sp.]
MLRWDWICSLLRNHSATRPHCSRRSTALP